jgi:hypothetical protein
MARRTRTYAIRLAVEGGGQVKAELVSVGQSGEQGLKRIESAGDRASGGLKGLGRSLTSAAWWALSGHRSMMCAQVDDGHAAVNARTSFSRRGRAVPCRAA